MPRRAKKAWSFSSPRATRFLRRAFLQSQRVAHFAQAFVLEITQHQRVAVLVPQLRHGLVQQRRQFLPGRVHRVILKRGLHVCLLFAALTVALDFQRVGGRKAGGAIEPAGKNGLCAERRRFSGQNDEHRLGDFLGQMRITRLPQRRRIDEAGDDAQPASAKASSDWCTAYSRTNAMSSVIIHLIHV